MRKRWVCKSLLIAGAVVVLSSCFRDAGDPVLEFVEGPGLVSADTMLMVGDTAKVGLLLKWNGKDDLTNLEVSVSDLLMSDYPVERNEGEYRFDLEKSASEREEWAFTLIDRKKHRVTRRITLTKDPNSLYGGVVAYQDITMGTQANPTLPGFLGLDGPSLYNESSAFINQAAVDCLVYYHPSDGGVSLACPAAGLPESVYDGDNGLASWQTRNTTLFMLSAYTPEQFSKFFHDGFLLTAFDEAAASDQVHQIAENQVYLFRDHAGRLGGLLVESVTSLIDGQAVFSIIMQEQ